MNFEYKGVKLLFNAFNKSKAFTLTEVLIAILIIGVIAALVLPMIVTKYQDKLFGSAFTRETRTIENAVNALAVEENKTSFFETMMYKDSDPTAYDDSVGKFMKKYMRVSKYCGDSNGNCFASSYSEYKDKDKVTYTPTYKGGCAILKNGMSICMEPQIGETSPVKGIIDLNGPKGPNVYGRDLREFSLLSIFKKSKNLATGNVITKGIVVDDPDKVDPCAGYTCGCGSLPACDPCAGKTCGCGSLPACGIEVDVTYTLDCDGDGWSNGYYCTLHATGSNIDQLNAYTRVFTENIYTSGGGTADSYDAVVIHQNKRLMVCSPHSVSMYEEERCIVREVPQYVVYNGKDTKILCYINGIGESCNYKKFIPTNLHQLNN